MSDPDTPTATLDVVVIGAGFAGLCMLHRLRELGFDSRVLEIGEGVGGTWYWNRYPGARVDLQAIEYSYSFSPEIEEEWSWTELMPPQPEIERYLNYVTDRLDLRKDIQFATRVTAAVYDEAAGSWLVETDRGQVLTCRYLVAATGCLSAPLTPDIPGIYDFSGASLYTSRFPSEGFDFTGKDVGVIGTGSSGVQTIGAIAGQVGTLTVFQRSAAFTRPANNRPLPNQEMEQLRSNYPERRRKMREAFGGSLYFGAVSLAPVSPDQLILEASPEQRIAVLDTAEWGAPYQWADVFVDPDANTLAVQLYAEMIRRTVRDPAVAESLVPRYPLGCKRPILDVGYFEAFNQPNVRLVDLRATPIERVTANGIKTSAEHVDLDVIVYATGFDGMTGALSRIDIRGRDGVLLRDLWAGGPRSLLGLQVAGFPNFFTITGPGSPAVLANVVMGIEDHVDWIADCLAHLHDTGRTTIEATEEAQDAWALHVAALNEGSVRTWPNCNSWWNGANVPGKPRLVSMYTGGIPRYRQECEAVAEAGYNGFILS